MTPRIETLRIAARVRLALRARARVDALDDRDLAAWRAERLRQLRRHAVGRSPRYRQLHRGLEDAPLEALPILTKAEVVEHFDELVTDQDLRQLHLRQVIDGQPGTRALGRYRVGASSGSSGQPGLFPFSETEWVELIATAARARRLAGQPDIRRPVRTARIGSPSPWHMSRQVAETLSDPRRPSLTLSAATDVTALTSALEEWQPHVLTGYPSVLAALAEVQLKNGLRISPVQVFTGGERLTPVARRLIEDAWGSPPFDQYLTTEAGFVAIECRHHDGLHILDDTVIVEVADAVGSPVAPGQYGERVLISVLGSRTLPLIRYELGDVASLAEGTCSCGHRSPRLRGVMSDPRPLLRLPGQHGGDVLVHPVAITSALDAAPVQAWQVVHGEGRLRVLVARPGPEFRPGAITNALHDAVAAAGASPLKVEVSVVETLVRTASGKAALVVSERAGGSAGV